MNRFYLLFILLTLSKLVYSQANVCDITAGCSDSPLVFPNTVDINSSESGPDYGCLETQPNPAWYYLGFDESGDVDIQISQIDNTGTPQDVDFICYGPFNDPFVACNNLSILNSSKRIDCSYSANAVENLNISNAQIGDFYILLITNYSNIQGNITMTQTNVGEPNAGSTDCSFACAVTLEEDLTFCLDSNYTLTSVLGNDSMEDTAIFKWFKNGIEIAGETSSSLDITALSSVGLNEYKLEVDATAALCEDISIDEINVYYVDGISKLKLTNISNIELCDTANNDGFESFDLSVNESEIANLENALDYNFTYYTDSALINQINNPTAYINETVYEETIYVVIEHNTVIGCLVDTQFKINVFNTPIATNLDDWLICNDNIGFEMFDFTTLENSILDGQNVGDNNITFHHTQDDADNNLNPLPLQYTNEVAFTDEEVFIRIENKNHTVCYNVSAFNINVIRLPIANPIPNWIVCDDTDNDGFYLFDFNLQFTNLLNGQDETMINTSFHKSQVDADFNIAPYALNYTNQEAFIEEEIFVRMESVENADCFDTTSFTINVIQNPIFDIVEDTRYICINLLPQTVDFKVEYLGNYTFSWQDALGNELSTFPTFSATQVGDYTVTATENDSNNCTTTKTVHVLPAEPAHNIQFITNEFWHKENFSLEVSVFGSGVYQYAIDDINGPYQEENLLTNIQSGVHTIYVKEMNDCGVSSRIVKVFGFSPFFTPNGDGQHDIWKVQGINFKPTAKIHIFDRYGKLMKTFFPANYQGWDGFYNGKPAPEGDYWFTAEMTDYNGNPKIRKGHFSLLRTNN